MKYLNSFIVLATLAAAPSALLDNPPENKIQKVRFIVTPPAMNLKYAYGYDQYLIDAEKK